MRCPLVAAGPRASKENARVTTSRIEGDSVLPADPEAPSPACGEEYRAGAVGRALPPAPENDRRAATRGANRARNTEREKRYGRPGPVLGDPSSPDATRARWRTTSCGGAAAAR